MQDGKNKNENFINCFKAHKFYAKYLWGVSISDATSFYDNLSL